MVELSNNTLIEISLSFMLGISAPSLVEAISVKISGLLLWFFVLAMFLGIIGTTIYFFLRYESKNNIFFIYETILIVYLTCWVYGIARIMTRNIPSENIFGLVITGVLFLGYGFWGLLFHRCEKEESWKNSFKNSMRVKFAGLSIFFIIIIPIVQALFS